jgi:hypothetical protein
MPVIGFLQRSNTIRNDFGDFREGLKTLGSIPLADHSMDTVVMTWTGCSIPDICAAGATYVPRAWPVTDPRAGDEWNLSPIPTNGNLQSRDAAARFVKAWPKGRRWLRVPEHSFRTATAFEP